MNYINIGIIVSAVLTIGLIVLQDRSSGTGGAFGSGDVGGFYQRRRGVEKFIFIFTIICIATFVGLALVNLSPLGVTTTAPATPNIKLETNNPNVKIENVTTSPAPANTGNSGPATDTQTAPTTK